MGLTIFGLEDEGDGRNDVRVARASEADSSRNSRFLAVRSDVAAATGPCEHGKVEISDLTRRHLPTCRSLEVVLAAVADSGKIRAVKWATLPPTARARGGGIGNINVL